MQPVFATEIQNENRECKMIVDCDKEKKIISYTELWNGIALTFSIHRFNPGRARRIGQPDIDECLEEYFIKITKVRTHFLFLFSFVFGFPAWKYREKATLVTNENKINLQRICGNGACAYEQLSQYIIMDGESIFSYLDWYCSGI